MNDDKSIYEKLFPSDEPPNVRKELIDMATEVTDKRHPRDKMFDSKKYEGDRYQEVVSAETSKIIGETVRSLLFGDPDLDVMIQDCIQAFKQKGDEYTVGSVDRLANFREAGEDIDVPMEKVWYIFFNKHFRSIAAYIKNGCHVKSSETIHSRIMDAIVYLLLFDKMSKEIEASRVQPELIEIKF